MKQPTAIQTVLISGGLIAAGYYAYTRIKKGQLQQANNMRFRIVSLTKDPDQGTVLTMLVQNPNNQEYSFKSVIGSLMIGGKQIANIKMFGNYTVRGNDQTTLPLIVQLLPNTAISPAKKTFLHFQGVVNINNKAIPLTLKYGR